MGNLALNGGTPVRVKPFPVWPERSSRQIEMMKEVYDSDKWGVGSPFIAEFEKRFAEFHHAKYGQAIMNGTAALWVAFKACGVSTGDEVITSPYTFIATGSAVLMANGVPVFVDIDPDTYNIDPAKIEAAITDKTKAIAAVHIAGSPADMDAICAIAKKHDLAVIEDAAQAHGAEWKGRRVGAIGDVGTFSFQSTKNMCAGEGGICVSDDEGVIDRCHSYANCGRIRGGKWYEHRVLGSNCRMPAICAGILLAQFDQIEDQMARRDRNARVLTELLSGIDGIEPLELHAGATRSAWHLYIFRYKAEAFGGAPRAKFIDAMCAEGINVGSGYVPLYREELFQVDPEDYPWLEGRDYRALSLPVCENACDNESVWLFQSQLLGDESDMHDIAAAVRKIKDSAGELK
ncbi:MAG: DegT/DnrJ/EryC1/StrS family aminotransferase [Phycisphaerae bacterium]|nr:DegT/DnrJ/EryC1/StrS family aminotransferase [Phycisphaerae bacterium]